MTCSKESLDLNSAQFNAEEYVQDLLRRKGLEELVTVEQDMVNNVRRLDSEMKSLVYENYSKFLNATSTVRDMQNMMDDTRNEMRDLSSRMKRITAISDTLTEKFARNCEAVRKLNEAKYSVKRLEFLIKVPHILQTSIEKGENVKAVEIYLSIHPKLTKFGHIPSMAGIAKDAELFIQEIKKKFHDSLKGRLISSEEVIEAVSMLKRLGVPERDLECELLANWEQEMNTELAQLAANAQPEKSRYPDIFEFVDTGSCHFLTNLSLMVSTFLQLFLKQTSRAEFVHVLERTMEKFEQIVDKRFDDEKNAECALFVKALDRIYRKISVLTRLSSGYNFSHFSAGLVQKKAKHQIEICRQNIIELFRKMNKELFLQFTHSSYIPSSSISDTGRRDAHLSNTPRYDRKELLKRTLEKMEHSVVHYIKSALAALLMFTASDIIFSTIPNFLPNFGFDVREQIIIGSMQDIIEETVQKITELDKFVEEENKDAVAIPTTPTELIILATLLRNLHLKHFDYLMELCQEQYRLSEFLSEQQRLKLTSEGKIIDSIRSSVESLLRKYIELESSELIQMARRGIEVFDWNGCTESPRRVRSIMKHLAQSMEEKNKELSVFMDDGGLARQKERTPDSLHGYFTSMRRAASAASSVYNDASSVSSGVVERLWGDTDVPDESSLLAVENVASMPIEFRRDLVICAIVRLLLRSICEFVRGQHFSRQGLEQLQVDCAFVRQKFWHFVADEQMLNTGIEDIVTSAVNSCAQPKLLDPSTVRSICEES